jgi:hypothetical protein
MNNIDGLDTDQIDKYLRSEANFKGVFPCDQIPDFPDNEYAVIINVDNSNLPGSHWTALVIRGSNGYYFDSFGRYYDNRSFPADYIRYLSKICVDKKMKFNDKVLQSFHSNTCGEFCIYFIKQLDKNIKFSTIFHDFTENLKFNDVKIMKLFKK